MGIIVTDGKTRLQFKGSIGDFEKAIRVLADFQSDIEGIKIDTVPWPDETSTCIELSFKGTMQEFEKVFMGLDAIMGRYSINTVPLPEKPLIGTWPTPDGPKNLQVWMLQVYAENRR